MKLITHILVIVLIYYTNLANANCPFGVAGGGVNKNEQQRIVDLHNDIRLKIAKGQLQGQPRGVNLKRMRWDGNLAKAAQDIANLCKFDHKKVTDGRWPSVGQNLAAKYFSQSSPGGSADWNSAVTSWINEHNQYKYGDAFSLKTGHYTQVVWAETTHVGCGYAHYQSNDDRWKYKKLYVCNYGPAGNYPWPPYKTGNSGCENLC